MKRPDPRRIFADVTATLEDIHAVALEGQSPFLTTDMVVPLVGHIRQGLTRIDGLLRGLPGTGQDRW